MVNVTGVTVSNGGLNALIPDMIRYLNFLLDTGEKENYAYVLKRSNLEEMWQVQHPVGDTVNLQENVGLAFFILDHQNRDGEKRRFIGHTGSQRGFQSFSYIQPPNRTAAILVMNTDVFLNDAKGRTYSQTRRILMQMREMVFEELMPLINE
jgi:CubicO group peptidase (beta-lactamase class C family)